MYSEKYLHFYYNNHFNNEGYEKDRIPNSLIDQMIEKIRGYRRLKVFYDDKEHDHSDDFVALFEDMKKYDPDLQRVHLYDFFNTLETLKGREIQNYEDPSLKKLLKKLQSYLE